MAVIPRISPFYIIRKGQNKVLKREYAALLICVLGCLITCRPVRADTQVKPDQGRFALVIQEAEIGSDTFTIKANGDCQSTVSVTLGGESVKMHNLLKSSAGHLTSILTDAGKQGKLQMTINGVIGKMTVGDKPYKDEKLPAAVYPVGNFAPHTFAFLIAAYDKAKSGAQQFSMIAIDGAAPEGLTVLKATLTALPNVVRLVSGNKIGISRYSLVIPGAIGNIDTEIDTDADGRILFWTVPGQKYTAIRDGYQDLAKQEKPRTPSSQSRFTQ